MKHFAAKFDILQQKFPDTIYLFEYNKSDINVCINLLSYLSFYTYDWKFENI